MAEDRLAEMTTPKSALIDSLADRGIPCVAGAHGAVDVTVYPMLALALRMQKKRPDVAISEAIGSQLTAWIARVRTLPNPDRIRLPHWRKA